MQYPKNIDELYKGARYLLLTHKLLVNANLDSRGNLHSTYGWVKINKYGCLMIYDKFDTYRIEIPKYAPFNHT